MRILFVCSFLWVGCEPQTGCTPGASVACSCTDGSAGAQLCKDDRTLDVCVCDSSQRSPGNTAVNGSNNNTGGMKRVFVTSTTYSVSALFGVCQHAADAATLGGKWREWLSSSTAGNAIEAIPGDGPWTRLDGKVAFRNHAQLGTQPSVPINVTEEGRTVDGSALVWTGTTNGGVITENCNDWSPYDAGGGMMGNPAATDSWTSFESGECAALHNVYCFEE